MTTADIGTRTQTAGLNAGVLPLHYIYHRLRDLCTVSERVAGFEPTPFDWKSNMLTVKHHTRIGSFGR